MKTFHHGGRIGDLLYALYTVKALGGGDLIISNRQQGNWSEQAMSAIADFARYQPYIDSVKFLYGDNEADVDKQIEQLQPDYNLVAAEWDNNPEDFPEWVGPDWPGNVHIAKRYAQHFGIEWVPGSTWLIAPKTKKVDVAFHCPLRRSVRSKEKWHELFERLEYENISLMVFSGKEDFGEWSGVSHCAPVKFTITADYINSAKVFVGGASSCNVCAEGLGKSRLVEEAQGCDNINPTEVINYWSTGKILEAIKSYL